MPIDQTKPQLIDRLPFVPFLLYAVERLINPGRDYTAITTLLKQQRTKVIQKSVLFHSAHNQLVHALRTEADAYRLLSSLSHRRSAKTATLTQTPGSISLTRPYQPGTPLEQLIATKPKYWNTGRILNVLDTCIADLQVASTHLTTQTQAGTPWIPQVPAWRTYALFPFYALVTLLRTPSQWRTILQLCRLFISQWWLPDLLAPSLVLAHRDLGPANILVNAIASAATRAEVRDRETVQLIDWESCAYGERETEYAVTARLYFGIVPKAELEQWVTSHIQTPAARRRFLRLSCFYVLQFLSSELQRSQSYAVSWQYASFLLELAVRTQGPSRTPYEHVWYGLLHGIALLRRSSVLRLLPTLSTLGAGQRVVLCYHSISHHPWRFALPPDQFARHLAWLKAKSALVALNTLLESSAKSTADESRFSCALTFDDGYADLLTAATPLLSEHHVRATAFVLAEPERAQRDQLDTQIPLLSLREVAKLPKRVWDIGSHTCTHPALGTLRQSELDNEFRTSKAILERKLKTSCRYLAYPQGTHSPAIELAARQAGYQFALSTDGGSVQDVMTQPHAIERIIIEQDMDEVELEALLTPLGLQLSKILVRLLKYKAVISSNRMR